LLFCFVQVSKNSGLTKSKTQAIEYFILQSVQVPQLCLL
jgi:hypothetical protein